MLVKYTARLVALSLLSVFGIEPVFSDESHTVRASPRPQAPLREESTVPPPLPRRYRGTDTLSLYLPQKPKSELACPSAMKSLWNNEYYGIKSVLKNLNFDPDDCVWDTVNNLSRRKDVSAQGFTFGLNAEISAGLGYADNAELTMVKVPGMDAIMVGVVSSRMVDLSLGFPGVSAYQGVIHGNCQDALYSYLGWFRTVGAAAISHSYGKDNWWTWNDTGCNSITSTRGTTTSLLNVSRSYYYQNGDFAIVTGPRVQPLLDALKRRNPNLR